MVYYDYLEPKFHKQKSFYNKAYYSVVEDNNYKSITLFSDNLKSGFNSVCKILIDKKHKTKSRYFITTNTKLLDGLTLKHIKDFILQFYNHKKALKYIIRRNKIVTDKMFEIALPLEN